MVRSLHLVTLAAVLSPVALAASILPRQAPPTCVVNCIGTSTAVTSCATSDFQCLCVSNAFIEAVATCLRSDCTAQEYDVGATLGTQYCASVGVTVSIPPRDAEAQTESTGSAASTENAVSSSTDSAPSSSSSSASSASTSSPASQSLAASTTSDAPAIAPSSAATDAPTSDTPHSMIVSTTAILAGAGVAMAILA